MYDVEKMPMSLWELTSDHYLHHQYPNETRPYTAWWDMDVWVSSELTGPFSLVALTRSKRTVTYAWISSKLVHGDARHRFNNNGLFQESLPLASTITAWHRTLEGHWRGETVTPFYFRRVCPLHQLSPPGIELWRATGGERQ